MLMISSNPVISMTVPAVADVQSVDELLAPIGRNGARYAEPRSRHCLSCFKLVGRMVHGLGWVRRPIFPVSRSLMALTDMLLSRPHRHGRMPCPNKDTARFPGGNWRQTLSLVRCIYEGGLPANGLRNARRVVAVVSATPLS